MQPKVINRAFNTCRNCGNELIFVVHTLIPKKWKSYWVTCGRCGYCTPNAHTPRGAVKKWNKVNSQVTKVIKAGTPPRGTKGEDA